MVFLRATVLALALYITQGERWTTTRVGVAVFVPKFQGVNNGSLQGKCSFQKWKSFKFIPVWIFMKWNRYIFRWLNNMFLFVVIKCAFIWALAGKLFIRTYPKSSGFSGVVFLAAFFWSNVAEFEFSRSRLSFPKVGFLIPNIGHTAPVFLLKKLPGLPLPENY